MVNPRSTRDTICDHNNEVRIQLKSIDGGVFKCRLSAAKMSLLVKNMLEMLANSTTNELANNEPIPLHNEAVTDQVLQKIIEWCEHHCDDPLPDKVLNDHHKHHNQQELSQWDKRFIDVADQALLFDIVAAANYMNIKGLVEVGAKHICTKIKGKSCEEIRHLLKITKDFTDEEEAAIREQNEWIYAKN